MLTTLVLATMLAPQVQTMNVPRIVYEAPIIGGQREVLLGPKPVESTILNGFFEKEIAPKGLITPGNTGAGYVDSFAPGGTSEYNLGYFDDSIKPDNLFEKPCVVLTSNAKWNQKMGRKPNQTTVVNTAKQQYWVTSEGKIVRQYYALQTPAGIQIGDCTYGKDSIQRRYTDIHGQTSFGEVFPACGMDALNAQFTPMVQEGKIVLRDKEYYVLNPLTGGLDKYGVHAAGTFKGEFLSASFKGKLFDIEGPNKFFEKVFLDDSGDLVKVSLNENEFFVISVVPSSHLDEYGRPIRKSGG